MKFEDLDQLLSLVQALQGYYSEIRVWDCVRKRVVYEAKGKETEKADLPAGTFRNVTLSLYPKAHRLVLVIPITLVQHTCRLELVRSFADDPKSVSSSYLQKLIVTDPLTGLYNRRYLDEQLPRDLRRALHSGAAVSLIYADIDHFKDINDTFGHTAGDSVLRNVAEVFRKTICAEDGWVARYGGDEFLVCLPLQPHAAAGRLADRIRKDVSKQVYPLQGVPMQITCSFGVETISHSSGLRTLPQIIGALDQKLYRAKRQGRNQIVE